MNESTTQRTDETLPARTDAGRARHDAMARAADVPITPTTLVAYASRGRLLVIGANAAVREVVTRLDGSGLTPSMLITEAAEDAAARDEPAAARAIHAPLAALRGHLGAFEVDVLVNGAPEPLAPSVITGNQPYDLVLDLSPVASLPAPVPPPGYFHCADDAALDHALAQLPDMVGEFEKPRYFDYDAAICAHGARGLRGCSRCIEACPTLAITSIGEQIEVDPHLCQGGGTCATACPTGAIRYVYPSAGDQVERLRALLVAYAEAGGERAVVLLHDAEAGAQWIEAHADSLPEQVLPVVLEEVGSAGLEAWLSAVAFGAQAVVALVHPGTPAPVRAELRAQLDVGNQILAGLSFADARLWLHEAGTAVDEIATRMASLPTLASAAQFAGVAGKREQLRLAIDHLAGLAPTPVDEIALREPAPFGRIEVSRSACTLCMSCATVCPAGAVLAGGDRPALLFVEQNCVQCGLCAHACPEDAIRLEPRLMLDRAARASRQVVMEDEPFGCERCGKIFGTTRTIERMVEKLASHWMYQDKPEQLARLRMCDECRVKDMFRDGGGLLDPHDGH